MEEVGDGREATCAALGCGRRSWGERTLPSRMAGAVGLAGEDAEQTGWVMAGVRVVRSGRAVLLAGGGTADGHGGRIGGYRAECSIVVIECNVIMGRKDGRCRRP